MEASTTGQDFDRDSLSALTDQCKAQIQDFKSGQRHSESLSCVEIVRRAAGGSDAALAALLEISYPIIEQKCPKKLQNRVEDVIQTVNQRLIQRMRKSTQPFTVSAFGQYHNYLSLTIKSVVLNMVRHEHPVESLEQLNEQSGYEPQTHSPVDQIERRILWERILAQLPDLLEREALDRRYRLGESIEEIIEALQAKAPGVTKNDVYRLLERALRRLRNNPLIQQMVIDLRS